MLNDNIIALINKINGLPLNEREIVNNFSSIHTLFDYFYNQKVYIKRNALIALKEEMAERFRLINFDKADRIFIILENYELKKGCKTFCNIDGINLLRKAKAKYLHCKRFYFKKKKQ